ncbi:glucuronate isomerase [Brachyspira hampsonii]|uniref:Uronate isomerase n=1 Tax=Brachyspira hampsonii TaxID=1287055 RepID=A0AAC9TV77_9SPIR|nr:glucuronate isomerase [Brachyspira hampsonii]ASJ21021.1 uronate isomerase [Brachyspira hampsonii]ELV05726.1 glucuronate isomerase [Brachyspira hampsonii 30599]MBW5380220.1 glucuronate isomerase [Brachyspira hampsonii]OEJ13250.1 glucuronate isomerase [Brachyspira hampsonii]
MRNFMDKDFLLYNDTSKILFHDYASKCPIFDYHCHLSPKEIAENKKFKNLTEIWLYGDHYKWRMMRANGIDEKFITGDAEDYDKFRAWVKTVPNLIGNPLYHWSHLELQRYFDIYEIINEDNADIIWKKANEKLQNMTVKDILKKFKVHTIGTTDDPIDDLEYHKLIREGKAQIGKIDTNVVPSFRPDKAINIEMPDFSEYIKKLEKASSVNIKDIKSLVEALYKRIDYFKTLGCVSSDCSLSLVPFNLDDENNIDTIFKKAMNKEKLSLEEIEKYKTYILIKLTQKYKESNLVMQIHISAMRNNNEVMFKKLGADTGYDSVGDSNIIEKLSSLLKTANNNGGLPKIIFYSLNNKDYYPLSTLMGCFQDEGIKGKMQLGSAWWFLDNKDGMKEQLKVLANSGSLALFVGMLTDSRSFLSYSRHEYFRRILCNLIGKWAEDGEVPNNIKYLGSIIENICFNNSNIYFNS